MQELPWGWLNHRKIWQTSGDRGTQESPACQVSGVNNQNLKNAREQTFGSLFAGSAEWASEPRRMSLSGFKECELMLIHSTSHGKVDINKPSCAAPQEAIRPSDWCFHPSLEWRLPKVEPHKPSVSPPLAPFTTTCCWRAGIFLVAWWVPDPSCLWSKNVLSQFGQQRDQDHSVQRPGVTLTGNILVYLLGIDIPKTVCIWMSCSKPPLSSS